ncbi:MAG TPA: copper chaperone PCu(A)C [Pseudonocardiaceae bacterium]|nr:copper chaperone PCu(A)C [Pseudonocardiaceae bacterium]
MTDLDVRPLPEADVEEPPTPRTRVTRRGLQITLGVLWLLDGLLQLQPFMFGSGFAGQVLAPAGDGQPGWVAAGVHWMAGLVGAHPVPWNAAFAIIQLALGVGLLIRPLVRIALAASIGWALGVWYFGEGLGGVAGGHGSLITGAPGAVLLYGLLAVVVWPERDYDAPAGWRGWLWHDSSGPPAAFTPVVWAVVWVGGAVLQALPGQNTPTDLASSLTGDMPAWQMGLNNGVANHLLSAGSQDNWLLLVVLVAVGLCALGNQRMRTITGWAGAGLATVFWMLGQGFGDLLSGQATDPNSGPLLVLLALALLGAPLPESLTDDEPELARTPAWRTSAMSGITAVVIVGVGLLQWGTARVTPPAHLAITSVYTPAGNAASAPVYFTLTNTGDGADTLVSAGVEFQTAIAAKGVSVCANQFCSGADTIAVPAHSTVVFRTTGPHLLVSGLGALAKGHQPLQVTLNFAKSGTVHVLSPVGSPADLTEHDIMTYAYMGGASPGMGMDMDGKPTNLGGTGSPATTMPAMPGMNMGGG